MKSSKAEIMIREHKIPEIRFEIERLGSSARRIVSQGLCKQLATKERLQECFSHSKGSPFLAIV